MKALTKLKYKIGDPVIIVSKDCCNGVAGVILRYQGSYKNSHPYIVALSVKGLSDSDEYGAEEHHLEYDPIYFSPLYQALL